MVQYRIQFPCWKLRFGAHFSSGIYFSRWASNRYLGPWIIFQRFYESSWDPLGNSYWVPLGGWYQLRRLVPNWYTCRERSSDFFEIESAWRIWTRQCIPTRKQRHPPMISEEWKLVELFSIFLVHIPSGRQNSFQDLSFIDVRSYFCSSMRLIDVGYEIEVNFLTGFCRRHCSLISDNLC
jgi:hypothetical protein